MKTYAIILSAGKGKRMQSTISKQYIEVLGYPVLYYTLKAFEKSKVDNIIIVAGQDDIEYIRKDIIEKYKINKVLDIVSGGAERYDSVMAGLKCISGDGNVLVHDGARPLIEDFQINKIIENLKNDEACVMGMPVKDTIKIKDRNNYVINTPRRSTLWQIQTPQAFNVYTLKKAYETMQINEDTTITDDSMVMERYSEVQIKLIEGSYENIKITTPEDLILMTEILKKRNKI